MQLDFIHQLIGVESIRQGWLNQFGGSKRTKKLGPFDMIINYLINNNNEQLPRQLL